MIPIILIQAIKLLTDFLYPPAALYRKKWYFHILLFTARQVGVYITLSIVLRGTSAAKISSALLPCKVPRDHCVSFPATSLTIFSVGAAYMPPAHLFLDCQCNLPSPCRGRACPAGAISVSKNHILARLNVWGRPLVTRRLGAATLFAGKLFHRQTGTGEQCPPQQEFF